MFNLLVLIMLSKNKCVSLTVCYLDPLRLDRVCNTRYLCTLVFASLSLNVVDIDCLMPCSSNNDNDVNNG